jgi:hypothetical protein
VATTTDLDGSITLELQSATTQLACEHDDPSRTDENLPENGDSIRIQWSARWVDRGMALDEDPPTRFEREIERHELELSRTGRNLTGAATVPVESVLERALLAYTWNESSNEFECRPRVPDSSALRDAAETLESACVWSPFLDGRTPTDSNWGIDVESLRRSIWPGGFGELGYGARGTTTADWQHVHIAVIPELPSYVDLWMNDVTGRARAELVATSDATAQAAEITVDIGGRIPLDVLLRRISESHSFSSAYWEMLNVAGDGIRWTLKGTSKLSWSDGERSTRLLRFHGEVDIRYDLEWSYLWDAPQVETFRGARSETWRGSVDVELRSECARR